MNNAASMLDGLFTERAAEALTKSFEQWLMDPYSIRRLATETRARVRSTNEQIAASLGLEGWKSSVSEHPEVPETPPVLLWAIVGGAGVAAAALVLGSRRRRKPKFVIPPGYHAWYLPKFKGEL